jgi:hypothetical protein
MRVKKKQEKREGTEKKEGKEKREGNEQREAFSLIRLVINRFKI